MISVHPIHRAEQTYGQPEAVRADSSYINNGGEGVDDFWDNDSLMGEKEKVYDPEEWAVPEHAFESAVLDLIGLTEGSSSRGALEPPRILLPVPRTSSEEKQMHESALAFLRQRVAELEEEELFESSMKSFTHRALGGMETDGIMGTSGIVSASASLVGGLGEPNAPGMGEQRRIVDVKELIRADVKEVWRRERDVQKEKGGVR